MDEQQIPDNASRVRVTEKGTLWHRIPEGDYAGMWVETYASGVRTSRGFITTDLLPYQGALVVEEATWSTPATEQQSDARTR